MIGPLAVFFDTLFVQRVCKWNECCHLNFGRAGIFYFHLVFPLKAFRGARKRKCDRQLWRPFRWGPVFGWKHRCYYSTGVVNNFKRSPRVCHHEYENVYSIGIFSALSQLIQFIFYAHLFITCGWSPDEDTINSHMHRNRNADHTIWTVSYFERTNGVTTLISIATFIPMHLLLLLAICIDNNLIEEICI